MASGMAIFSVVTSLVGMGEQQKAGRQAKAAGEEGARSILAETTENIKQARKSQAQKLGLAKAITAASGVKFDAAKIGKVQFTEGGVQPETGQELTAGEQIAGEEEGGTAFMYLREMKKSFAEDIGWMGKQGRSRARVAQMGGQVSAAQAEAGAIQTAASGIGQAYDWWRQPTAATSGAAGAAAGGAPSPFSGQVTSMPSVFNQ